MAAGRSALFMLLPALCREPATSRLDIVQIVSDLVKSAPALYSSIR